MDELLKRSITSGTVKMKFNDQRTNASGNCPKCQKELVIYADQDGSYRNLIACMHCKEIYKVEIIDDTVPQYSEIANNSPQAFFVYYTIKSTDEPDWNKFFMTVTEGLFDNVGEIEEFDGGFICKPDARLVSFPTIIVNSKEKQVCFRLTGFLKEREAGGVINQAVSEFGERFKADLHPRLFECWGYNKDKKQVLIERRKLGQLLEDNIPKRQGRA